MPEPARRLRAVGPEEGPRPRRPGPAVLAILLYAILFGGALWYLRSKSPLFQRSRANGSVPSVVPVSSDAPPARDPGKSGRPGLRPLARDALLSGSGLPENVRAGYFHRLAVDRCDCGCERTLSDCLANEPKCSRSPALAGKAWAAATGKE